MKQWKTHNERGIRIVTVFLIFVLLFGCSNPETSPPKKQQEQKKTETIPVIYKKPPSSFSDTMIIRGKSAVFYSPDSLQLEKIKAIIDNVTYENNNHDCFFQMRNARMVLKKYWPQIRIIETSKARYLLFISADKSRFRIDLNAQNDQCGIFLFEDGKNPKLVDMMNIDTELGFYFSK